MTLCMMIDSLHQFIDAPGQPNALLLHLVRDGRGKGNLLALEMSKTFTSLDELSVSGSLMND